MIPAELFSVNIAPVASRCLPALAAEWHSGSYPAPAGTGYGGGIRRIALEGEAVAADRPDRRPECGNCLLCEARWSSQHLRNVPNIGADSPVGLGDFPWAHNHLVAGSIPARPTNNN